MSGFNTSTRKEDVSARLKAHSLRNAKDQTKQLETESRKMEERLKELKLVMSREKEERERQGGIFWKSGQEGGLSNHAQNVLSRPPGKPKEKGQRTRKIKVLKETPVETQTRSKAQPGTMAFIAQRDGSSTKENRSKGPKCGQCEQKSVSVSCMECSENYCAQCFAAFHMKGALRKHRSVPFKVASRAAPSPRPPPRTQQPINSRPHEQLTAPNDNYDQYSSGVRAPSSSQNGLSHVTSNDEQMNNGGSLFDGAYDESESAQSFQDALKAWRGGGGDAASTLKPANTPVKSANPRAFTPVKSPIVIIESSTSTSNSDLSKRQDIDIKFNSGVSYTDKLLLKQHRRSDVDSLQLSPRSERIVLSPRRGSCRSSRGDSVSPYSHPLGSPRTHRRSIDDVDGERVHFQSLFEAVNSSGSNPQSNLHVLEPGLKIEDISQAPSRHNLRDMEEGSHYEVEELGETLNNASHFLSVHPVGQPAIEVFSPVPHIHIEPVFNEVNTSSPASRLTNANPEVNKPELDAVMSRPQSRTKSRAKQVPNYKNNRANTENRPASGASSRPGSRTRPRSSKEKHGLRNRLGDVPGGGLTKHPSDGLTIIARMMADANAEKSKGLSEFFTAGVDSTKPGEDRVLIPTADKIKTKENKRPESAKKITVSNKLYQMAPRTWRPDSSLGSNVDDSDVYKFYQDFNIKDYLSDVPLDDVADEESTISFSLNAEPPTFSRKTSIESYSPFSKGHDSRRSGEQLGANIPSTVQEGRQSRLIVVDGDDLSKFDFKDRVDGQNMEDEETLDKLEWELASESGRITADGKISRLTNLSPSDENDLGINEDNGRGTGLSSPPDAYDVDDRFRDDDLMDDFEDLDDNVENEVKALF